MLAGGALAMTSCNDYLETNSPSVVDGDFVFSNERTARAALDGAYESWRSANTTQINGDGLFYAADIAGSDIMRHPENFANQPGRHYPESFYQNGTFASNYGLLTYLKEGNDGAYNKIYDCITKCNAIINAIGVAPTYTEAIAKGETTSITQLHGEAVALRAACYDALIKYFGDVPYRTVNGVESKGLASRDSIYDCCIAELIDCEKYMNTLSEKSIISKTFVDALIGRMCLNAAGYQTRRADLGADFYKNGKGEVVSYETMGTPNNDNCYYGRRSDWKELYATAKTYFKMAIDNHGTATFHETDPRSNGKEGQIFNNPYQYFFQQMNDLSYADESLFECALTQGAGNSPRPYSLGRPSNGGGSNAFPCKDYGQGRINPAFYYGEFDPKDMRRDVSITCTGSTGKGVETLIPFAPNSKASGGGLSCNKWDENRMKKPWVKKNRQSGINVPIMRMSEVYLGYAEACAITGDNDQARAYLDKIRNRAFGSAANANTDAFISKCGGLFKAIIQERGFEFAAEGDRRWTLIRTGLLPEAIKHIKEETRKMIDGLKTNGYYEFENGNVISNYVWTKLIDAKDSIGYRLTTQCPAGKEDNGLLYPGWRGQNDDWEKASEIIEDKAKHFTYKDTKTNLAIKGLFSYIDPNGAEAAELQAQGFKKQNWGIDIVNNEDEYYKYLFYDYDYTKAPIYLWPFTPNIISTGGFTNGYGFAQK